MKSELINIQILRAIAAISVVLFHSYGVSIKYGYEPHFLSALNGWGFGGVDLFFVISGFIMVYIQDRKKSTPVNFIVDRFLRIIPLYWFFTAILFFLYLLLPSIFSSQQVSFADFFASLFFLSQLVLSKFPVLYDGWTLEFEIFFYLIFASSLMINDRNRAIIFCVVVLFVFSFVFKQYFVLEFGYGMIIGVAYLRYPDLLFSRGFIFVSLLAYISTVFFRFDGIDRSIVYGLPAFFIVAFAVFSRQYSSGWWSKIGDASFSIYLIQVFTIPFFYKALTGFGVGRFLNDFYFLLSVAFTALLGVFVYVFIERRFLRAVSKVRSNLKF